MIRALWPKLTPSHSWRNRRSRNFSQAPEILCSGDAVTVEDVASVNERKVVLTRRLISALSLLSSTELIWAPPAQSIMGMTAGRVPGFSKVDDEGFRFYTRPEGKSGGHGVGWSEITPYSFRAVQSWEEVPVSIADPAGTEIDAKFVSESDGALKIVLAPILRFSDKGDVGDIDLNDLVSADNFLKGFAPELLGGPIQEGDVVEVNEVQMNNRTYYSYELMDHTLVSATAWNKRIYICVVTCTPLQWRRSKVRNRLLVDSFRVMA